MSEHRPDGGRDELADLLAAYALDALEPGERADVEALLDADPEARREVERYRETASLLAFAGTDAPAGLWERIEARLSGTGAPPRLRLPGPPGGTGPATATPPTGTVVPIETPRRARRARTWLPAAAAAAVVALAGVLGVQVWRQSDRIARLEQEAAELRDDALRRAADEAARSTQARLVELRSDDGRLAARVIYLPDGTGFFEAGNLLPLDPAHTYQLWALVGDPERPTVISAGVLGNRPTLAPFQFTGPVVGFVVTEEEAPGVISSDNPALLAGTL
jgi:anti-sigma factor RsiW